MFDSNRPNIVVVQLESFFDVNRLKDIEFSENPLPNFTQLSKRCASGFLSVPVIGAGTVNSEFEMLTGMNIDDFGIGEYPYKTVLKEKTCESLAYNLNPTVTKPMRSTTMREAFMSGIWFTRIWALTCLILWSICGPRVTLRWNGPRIPC